MNKTLLILIISLLESSVFTNDDVHCEYLNAFTVCDESCVLTFVNQTRDAELLKLDPNKFSSIAPNAFQNLRIEKIHLELNLADYGELKVMNFSKDSFKGLPRVNELLVDNLIFPLQPNPFKDLRLLTHLSISANVLTEVPGELIADFPHLTTLGLNKNDITSIARSSFTGANENMEEIWLRLNKISTIEPKSFSKFKNLKMLSLDSNELTSIAPGTFDGLDQLENLKLSFNKITAISRNTFSNLLKLKMLFLDFNEISEIEPQAFDGLSIQYLILSYNKLENLQPGAFEGLAQLQYLNLEQSHMHTVPSNVFNGLTKLERLNLKGSKIDQIEQHSFSGLTLNTLDLHLNHLSVIEPGVFSGLSVITLDLAGNRIAEIKPQAFSNLTVQKILLYSNAINSVDKHNLGLNESVEVVTGFD